MMLRRYHSTTHKELDLKAFNKKEFNDMLHKIEDGDDFKQMLSSIQSYLKSYHEYYQEPETKEILDSFNSFKKVCTKNIS